MKKYLIRFLSLLLVTVILVQSLVACADDTPPPDNENGEQTENGGEEPENNASINNPYIQASLSGWDTKKLCDFTSEEFIANNGIAEHLFTVDGKTGYKWDLSLENNLLFYVPEASRNVQGYYYFEISVYSEAPTNAKIQITFGGAGSIILDIDFKGWRTFQIQTDNLTVKNPYPQISSVSFSLNEGSFDTVYLSEPKAVNPIYHLTLPEGVSIDDPKLYESIIDAFRESIVGPETPMDNDAYRKKAENSQNNGKSSWALFKETSANLNTPETLFDIKVFNIDYAGYGTPAVNGGRVQSFYAQVYCMAQGYGVPGTELYKNPELLADILTALEYGYTFYYGKDIVETGVTYGNWWEWDIGIPMYLIESLTIISKDIDSSLLSKYLAPFDKIVELPPGAACNLVDMSLWVILSAALQNDGYRICAAKELMSEVFVYLDRETDTVKPGDGGFYTDGSFIQHNGTPYAGAYGANLLNSISSVMIVLKDSRFAFTGEMLNRQFEWVLDSYRPFIYGTNFMSFLCGRDTSRNKTEKSRLIEITASMIKISYYAPDEYKAELLSLIKYVMDETGEDFAPKMQYPLISYCEQIKNDSTILPIQTLNETRVFGAMDRIVQHTPDYAVGIALSSTRIYKYESINGENKAGWYHGDGMIYIYTDGYDYNNIYYWYANPYLMPGTTVSNAPRKTVCIYPSIYNTSPYAGGVAQGKYGTIGFILGYPQNASAFESDEAKNISAKKSYFLFDNEIVCLGSDIYDESGTGVRTVVENRLWKDGNILSVNGVSIAPATAETTIEARTMHFTGMGGYVFLDDNEILYSKSTNSYNNTHNDIKATGTRDFLEISLSHGEGKVENGKYSYVYLPEATVEETEDYYARYGTSESDVVILHRNTDAHAVIEKKLGVIGCNFFNKKGGTVENFVTDASAVTTVKANTECSVMVCKNADGSYTVSVADPTQLNGAVKVTVAITGITEVVSADSVVTTTVSGGVATLTVNTENALGATFNATVK